MMEWLIDIYIIIGFYIIAAYCIMAEFYVDRIRSYGGLSRVNHMYRTIKKSKFINQASGRKLLAVLTGADGAIGTDVTRLLLQNNFRVICFIRDRSTSKWKDQFHHPDVLIEILDLTDLKKMKKKAKSLADEHPPVDLIICNAGVMLQPFARTADGFETHYAVNLLSHAILVNYFLQNYRARKCSEGEILAENCALESRVIFISSATAHLGSFFNKTMNIPEFFTCSLNSYQAYSTSKFAVTIYAEELNNRLQEYPLNRKVTVISLHPGCVPSGLYQYVNRWSRALIFRFLRPIMRNSTVAAAEIVALGCEDNLKGGCYYQHMVPTKLLCNTTKQHRKQLYEHVQNIMRNI